MQKHTNQMRNSFSLLNRRVLVGSIRGSAYLWNHIVRRTLWKRLLTTVTGTRRTLYLSRVSADINDLNSAPGISISQKDPEKVAAHVLPSPQH